MSSLVLPSVLLTGASKGIGRAIAIELAKTHKYKLALLSRDAQKLQETADLCRAQNKSIQILQLICDVTDELMLKQKIDECGKKFGPLCVLINNAGVFYSENVGRKMDPKLVKKSIDVNLNAVILGCMHAMPYLKQSATAANAQQQKEQQQFNRTGSQNQSDPNTNACAIININSCMGSLRETFPGSSIYCATKFGLRGFADCLFQEISIEHGIHVCSIMPGWVNTDMVYDVAGWQDMHLQLAHMIQPKDVAAAVLYALNCSRTCCPLEIVLKTPKNVFGASDESDIVDKYNKYDDDIINENIMDNISSKSKL